MTPIPSRASGIYLIRNTVSGSVYVGSAKELSARSRCHRSQLRRGRHVSEPLTRAYEKYGEAALTFEVLEVVDDPALLVPREQFWIDVLRPAYNTAPTAGNTLGYRFTPEQRAVLSAAQRAFIERNPERAAANRERIRELGRSGKGRAKKPDTRARMSAAQSLRKGVPRAAHVVEKLRARAIAQHSAPASLAKRRERDAEILRLHEQGFTQAEIAAKVPCSGHVVNRVVRVAHPEKARRHNGRANSSGIRGILWHKKNRRWTVSVYPGGGSVVYLGSFETIEQAQACRQRYLDGDTFRAVRKQSPRTP